MFKHSGHNHHYIAQVEQKLNSIDPKQIKKNRRIFEFELLDREQLKYKLTDPIGVKIESNLSANDLYSFELFSDKTTSNFENFFGRYENNIEKFTSELITKLQNRENIDKELLHKLVFAKLLNFIRNPFSIEKVINTFGMCADLKPVDAVLLAEYEKLEINNPLIDDNLLIQLKVTREQFVTWLKTIFVLVVMEINGKTIGELFVESILDKSSHSVLMRLYSYDSEICLLSDRGFTDLSAAFTENEMFSISFNLTKNAFLIVNIGEITKATTAFGQSIVVPIWSLDHKKNDIEMLCSYNRNVIYQCFNNFYSSDQNFKIFT